MPKEATVRSIAAATRGKDQDAPSALAQMDDAMEELARVQSYLKLFAGLAEPDGGGAREMMIDREALHDVMGDLAQRLQIASRTAAAAHRGQAS